MDPHNHNPPATTFGSRPIHASRREEEEARSKRIGIAQAAKTLMYTSAESLSGQCGEAFPHDPDFPQLRVASDRARMLELFRHRLRPVPGRTCQIEDCQPFRFRCRQSGGRCVLQFTLRVREPGTGRRWNQWVTGLVYAEKGKAERLWREMARVDQRREIPESWLTFEPVDFIPELQMLVQVFPCDRKLPNLCALMGGRLRDIEPLLLARLGPGQWQVDQRHIEPTRYRTELAAALKYTIQARDARVTRVQTTRCYLKVYRDGRGEGIFELLQSLAATTRDDYATVRPIAYLSELRTLVLEEAAGTPLSQHLLQGRDPAEVGRAVGRAAAAFNRDCLGNGRRQYRADQLDDLQRDSSLVQWACPPVRAAVRAIIGAVVASLEDVPPAPIHRDLKPDHIFLSGDRVIFIDLDSAVLGDPVRDAAHLFAHFLAGVGLEPLTSEQTRPAAAAFLETYFAQVPKPWRRRFPLQCAGALIEVASGIFRRQEPQWSQKVVAAVEEAEHVLSGGFN